MIQEAPPVMPAFEREERPPVSITPQNAIQPPPTRSIIDVPSQMPPTNEGVQEQEAAPALPPQDMMTPEEPVGPVTAQPRRSTRAPKLRELYDAATGKYGPISN